MNCDQARRLVHALADDELDLVSTLELEGHLRDCAACASVRESIGAVKVAVRGVAPRFPAPSGLRRRVLAGVRRETRSSGFPVRGVGIAASLFLVACAVWAVLHGRPAVQGDERLAEEIVAGHVRSLMAGHITDVASSDQHTVKPWFVGRLDFAPPARDMADAGFPLAGGRLDYVAERAVAALVYTRGKHTINLFVWPAAAGKTLDPVPRSVRGYNLSRWTSSGLAYWAVSDLNPRELDLFVRSFRERE